MSPPPARKGCREVIGLLFCAGHDQSVHEVFARRPRVQNARAGVHDHLRRGDLDPARQVPDASQRPESVLHDHGDPSPEDRYVRRPPRAETTITAIRSLLPVALLIPPVVLFRSQGSGLCSCWTTSRVPRCCSRAILEANRGTYIRVTIFRPRRCILAVSEPTLTIIQSTKKKTKKKYSKPYRNNYLIRVANEQIFHKT